MHHIFLLHSPLMGTQVVAMSVSIVNNTAGSMEVQVFLQDSDFALFEHTPRSSDTFFG